MLHYRASLPPSLALKQKFILTLYISIIFINRLIKTMSSPRTTLTIKLQHHPIVSTTISQMLKNFQRNFGISIVSAINYWWQFMVTSTNVETFCFKVKFFSFVVVPYIVSHSSLPQPNLSIYI